MEKGVVLLYIKSYITAVFLRSFISKGKKSAAFIPQAEAFTKICDDVTVVNFVIKDEEVIKRLSTRRVCKKCGTNFNVLTLPPKKEGVCDNCGGELYQRDDDKQESILHRMDVYREQTEPLIDFYRTRGKLTDIDGAVQTPQLLNEFGKIFPKK